MKFLLLDGFGVTQCIYFALLINIPLLTIVLKKQLQNCDYNFFKGYVVVITIPLLEGKDNIVYCAVTFTNYYFYSSCHMQQKYIVVVLKVYLKIS